jgi:hypothetical protein
MAVVAEKTAMPRQPKRDDLAVKIDKEVVRMARILAAIEDTTIAELMSETLRPILQKKLDEHKRRGFDR